jgi:hypothetical protein
LKKHALLTLYTLEKGTKAIGKGSSMFMLKGNEYI